VTVCVRTPLDHPGRCRGADGSTWENNHPATQAEQDARALVDRITRDRDAAHAALAALETANTVLAAARTLTALALHADPMTDDDYDAQTAAANVLAPLLGVPS